MKNNLLNYILYKALANSSIVVVTITGMLKFRKLRYREAI